MAQKSTPKTKKEFTLLKCTDPERPDWTIFSKLLRRQEGPGNMSEEQAATRLKALLVEAYATNCDELVTAAYHKREGKGKSRLMTLFDSFGSNPRTRNFRRLEWYELIRTRLLLPEDGRDRPVSQPNIERTRAKVLEELASGKIPADTLRQAATAVAEARAKNLLPTAELRRAEVATASSPAPARPQLINDYLVASQLAKTRAVSSQRMLDYWNPEALGVLPYVSARIDHVMWGLKEEVQMRNRMESIDAAQTAGQEYQMDASGMGRRVRRERNGSDLEDDIDPQEAHDAGREADDGTRLAAPADETIEGLGDLGGAGDASAHPSTQLRPHDKAVRLLEDVLDSMLAEETDGKSVNNSPLFNPAFIETLAAEDVTLSVFKQMTPFMAEPRQAETPDQHDARVTAELEVAREIVATVGGIHRFPDDVAQRMIEAMAELAPDETPNEGELLDRDPEPEGPAAAPAPSNQRLAYAFSQSRKLLTVFSKANRPEFELFGLVLGEVVTPSESPEARSVQLAALARRVALEKCQGMDTPEDIAKGATVESAVAEWDPSSSGFGRRYPDILDHLETQAALEQERKVAAALEAAAVATAALQAEAEARTAKLKADDDAARAAKDQARVEAAKERADEEAARAAQTDEAAAHAKEQADAEVAKAAAAKVTADAAKALADEESNKANAAAKAAATAKALATKEASVANTTAQAAAAVQARATEEESKAQEAAAKAQRAEKRGLSATTKATNALSKLEAAKLKAAGVSPNVGQSLFPEMRTVLKGPVPQELVDNASNTLRLAKVAQSRSAEIESEATKAEAVAKTAKARADAKAAKAAQAAEAATAAKIRAEQEAAKVALAAAEAAAAKVASEAAVIQSRVDAAAAKAAQSAASSIATKATRAHRAAETAKTSADAAATKAAEAAKARSMVGSLPATPTERRRLAITDFEAKSVEDVLRTPEMQVSFATHNALETDFWTATCRDPEDLNNSTRIDYRFLCDKTGSKPVINRRGVELADEQLHAEVKKMAVAWIGNTVSARQKAYLAAGNLNIDTLGGKDTIEGQFCAKLQAVAAAYDPASDGYFSETLNDFLRSEIALDQQRIRQAKSTPTPPADGEESLSMHVIAPPPSMDDLLPLAGNPGVPDDLLN